MFQKRLKALEAKIDSIAALRFADNQIRDSLAALALGESDTKIQLQINTDPMNCQIYIDDKLVGVSPISWWLERNSSHVIQAQLENYRTDIRMVSKEEMIDQEKLIIIQRLEPFPEISQVPEELNLETESLADSTSSPDSINNVDEETEGTNQENTP